MAKSEIKVMREIANVEPTQKETVLLVTFASGEKCRINRNLAEFWPGRVFIPKWLDKKIFSKQ